MTTETLPLHNHLFQQVPEGRPFSATGPSPSDAALGWITGWTRTDNFMLRQPKTDALTTRKDASVKLYQPPDERSDEIRGSYELSTSAPIASGWQTRWTRS